MNEGLCSDSARKSAVPQRLVNLNRIVFVSVIISVVDPDPHWIHVQEPSENGSGSTHVNVG